MPKKANRVKAEFQRSICLPVIYALLTS